MDLVYLAVSAVIGGGIGFFSIWCYRKGLSDGMTTAQNKLPKPMIEKKLESKEIPPNPMMDTLSKMLGYDPMGDKQ